ncbi:MAG: heme exporter protein CcmD [Hyphomicrobiaceae bacterium]
MPDLGPHAMFIWSAYGVVALVLAVLVLWILADGRRQRALLQRLEGEGLRRSDRSERATR